MTILQNRKAPRSRSINLSFIIYPLSFILFLLLSGCKEDHDAPQIDSVWKNMVAEPIVQTDYAYPKQTICLHGSGFSHLKRIVVNDTRIDVTSTQIYDTDNYITFQLPEDVNTYGDYIKVVTPYGEAVYQPFYVRPASQQPVISSFSTTLLQAGQTLTITGRNLDGVREVWLPQPFDGRVQCQLDPDRESTSTTVYVIIPEATGFAKGQCEMVLEKTDEERGRTYTERVFSAVTNFQ